MYFDIIAVVFNNAFEKRINDFLESFFVEITNDLYE